MNKRTTCVNPDAKLTHANPVSFLIAKRVAAGANTPIGHRCSNLIELLDNYAKAEGEEQRSHLERNIRKQMAELAARHQ